MKCGPRTTDHRPRTNYKKKLLFFFFLTLIFKNVTHYDIISQTAITLKEGKLVDSLVLRKAKRNWIEYGANITGDRAVLMSTLQKIAGDQFTVESNQKENELEIIFLKTDTQR